MFIMKSKMVLLLVFSLIQTNLLPVSPTVAEDQMVDDEMSVGGVLELVNVNLPFISPIPSPNNLITQNEDELNITASSNLNITVSSNPTYNNDSSVEQLSNPTVNSLGLSHSTPFRNITDDTVINHPEEGDYSDEERSLASVDAILNYMTFINPLISPLDDTIHNPFFTIFDKCDKCKSQKEKCNCSFLKNSIDSDDLPDV
ncbi:hypothetical protein TUBRATIS_009810 [Tubulinosema ratisbonensis]|uniref:Uncharacterized protein n=1 Tax=Tubulinosema ratisbonensis TaxID=291195 RepID=A0A437ANE6_9MICR|nr:hypothetical protein TUBRATIS_009810 [Tubulinosema ratisbonensis]